VKTIEVGGGLRTALARAWDAVGTPAGATLVVGGLILAAFAARVLLAFHVAAPWVMPDELEYADTSRSFISSGHYLMYDHPDALRTIYPVLISPAWLAGSTPTAYALVKVINTILMTLGAIPLYFWARRLVTRQWAAVAVVLYLAIPGFNYSAEVVTEDAFLPTAILAMLAFALALERPTVRRQLLALGSVALVAATRLQGLVFLIVLPTAIALVLSLDAIAAAPGARRTVVLQKLRRFWPSFAGIAVAAIAYVLYEVAQGHSISQGLGSYSGVPSAHYSLRPVLHWSAYHLGELAFAVGLIPVSALIVLFGLACRRSTAPSPAERAFLAVTTAAILWIVVEVAAFASQYSLRIEDRYLFALDAPLLLALVVWLARGLPRPSGLLAAGVLASASLLLALPYQTFFREDMFTDTFGLVPLWRLNTLLGTNAGDLPILVAAGALLAGLLFAVIPRYVARMAVPVAVGGFLVLSSASVFGQVSFLANSTRHAGGLAGDPNWIDRAVGKDSRVEVIYTSDISDPHVVWQTEFWNRSVRRLFGLSAQDPSIPDVLASVDSSGRIHPSLPSASPDAHAHLFVTANDVAVAGARIATAGQLVLWRTAGPLQLRNSLTGMTRDGWTGPTAAYTVYLTPPGTRYVVAKLAQVKIAGLPPAQVRVAIGPTGTKTAWERQTVTLPSGGTRRLRLRIARRGPFQVLLSVSPTFTPTQYGLPDTRTLGVRASFSLSR
jgi:hypothetical protein